MAMAKRPLPTQVVGFSLDRVLIFILESSLMPPSSSLTNCPITIDSVITMIRSYIHSDPKVRVPFRNNYFWNTRLFAVYMVSLNVSKMYNSFLCMVCTKSLNWRLIAKLVSQILRRQMKNVQKIHENIMHQRLTVHFEAKFPLVPPWHPWALELSYCRLPHYAKET